MEKRNLILEYINRGIEDEPNSLCWYGIKFAALLMEEEYEELMECIDDVLKRHKLSQETLLELKMEVMKKMQSKRNV